MRHYERHLVVAAANDGSEHEHDVHCCGHGGVGNYEALDLELSCDLSHSAVDLDSWCDCDGGAQHDDDDDACGVDDWDSWCVSLWWTQVLEIKEPPGCH